MQSIQRPYGPPELSSLSAIDLFAGCGGMSLGLKNAGFIICHANEINNDAAATYRFNFPEVPLMQADVSSISLPKIPLPGGASQVDLIAAGPPCQGFSCAGLRSHDDPRNSLFLQAVRYVKHFRPKIVVIENVLGMLYAKNGQVMQEIDDRLRKLGYFSRAKVLSASDYGVPQNRKRVFIISSRKAIPMGEMFPPIRSGKISVGDAISDLSFLGVNDQSNHYVLPPSSAYQRKMRKNSKVLCNHVSTNHSAPIQKRFASISIGEDGKRNLRRIISRKRDYFKFDPSLPSRTLTTLPEDFIHYSKNRTPTVREMARLQSFPDTFIFRGPRNTGGDRRRRTCPQYTQVGNAVPPLMAEAVFKNLARVIKKFHL